MDDKKIKSLRIYFRWPLFLLPVLLGLAVAGLFVDYRVAAAIGIAAVVYLLSAESVTGVVLPVDAGQHLLPPAG